MIRLNVLILSMGILALLNAACHASGDNRPSSTSFVGKKWHMEKLTASPSIDWDVDGVKDTDIFALLEPCDKDDYLILREDGIVIRNGGAEKCDEDEDNQWEDGTWQYDAATGVLTFSMEGKLDESKVLESNSEKLILEYHFKSTKGEEHTLTAVYQVKR